MGVPPKNQFSQQPAMTRVNSGFCEISSNLSCREERSCDYKVYNLSVEDYPCGVDFQGEGIIQGYHIIMDVGEPVTITTKKTLFTSTFTTYLIRVETNYPTFSNTFNEVRRRYTEFTWLREQLLINHPHCRVPNLPPKKFFSFMNFSADFIQQRLKDLSIFMQRVLETPTLLRDPALLFFLESDLSVEEMEEAKGHQLVSSLAISSPSGDSLLVHNNRSLRNSLGDVSGNSEDTVEEEDLNGQKSLSEKSQDSERSGCDAVRKRLVPQPQPIIIKNIKGIERRVSSDSDMDSGHFDASSSASISPPAAVLARSPPTASTSKKWMNAYREEDEYITKTSSSPLLDDHFMLFSPAISYYVMQ